MNSAAVLAALTSAALFGVSTPVAKTDLAYNADRGPVSIFSARLHGDF
jgi:hypothetical protein